MPTALPPAAPVLSIAPQPAVLARADAGLLALPDFSIQALSDGGFAVVSVFGNVLFQRFNSNGEPVFNWRGVVPENVVDLADGLFIGSNANATLTELSDGRIAIAYEMVEAILTPERSVAGYHRDSYVQIIDANGTPVGGRIALGTSTTDDEIEPHIRATPDGGFVVVWNRVDPQRDFDVVIQRFDAQGAPLGEAALVGSPDLRVAPVVEVLADGRVIAVWLVAGGSGFTPVAQIFGADGQPDGSAFTVGVPGVVPEPDDMWNASVLPRDDGGFVIAWVASYPATGRDIVIQHFDAAGEAVGQSVRLDTGSAADQLNPEVVALPDGGYLVVWSQGNTVRGQRFEADGDFVGGVFQLAGNLSIPDMVPQSPIAVLTDGTIVLGGAAPTSGDIGSLLLLRLEVIGAEDDSAIGNVLLVETGSVEAGNRLDIVLSGHPAGATFSMGVAQADGTWLLSSVEGMDLAGLTMTPPENWNGTFTLTARGIVTDVETGLTAERVVTGTVRVQAVNDVPEVVDALPDVTRSLLPREIAAGISLDLGSGFSDAADPDDSLTFSARLADGSALPDWMQIDPVTGRLTGRPVAGDQGVFDIIVTAEDGAGASAEDQFTLTLGFATNTAGQIQLSGLDGQGRLVEGQTVTAALVDPDAPTAVSYQFILTGRGGQVVVRNSVDGSFTPGFDMHDFDVDVRVIYADEFGDHLLRRDLGLVSDASVVTLTEWRDIVSFADAGTNVVRGDAATLSLVDSIRGGAGQDTLVIEGDGLLSLNGVQLLGGRIGKGMLLLRQFEHVDASGYTGPDGLVLGGNAGNSWLRGGAGDDRLVGLRGQDTLTGGCGADVFVFRPVDVRTDGSGATDLVTDFETGVDRIGLRAIDANVGTAGNAAFLWAGESTDAVAHSVTWYRDAGRGSVFVQMDVNGDSAADLVIELAGVAALAQGDVLL
ncbi:putative Ig domain-containing protein [Tabrizicola sp. M-4]|uniref:putative Ig domain-containing protein n=1 Tax=Tabrizicola sp. M-4 TaxID=3055847 RepID=UPI003DA8E54B